jgi:hypothetical protein
MANSDDASQSSDDESVLILAQIAKEASFFAQEGSYCTPIGYDLVLLNSQFTVDLFSNPTLVNNICPADTPINVPCNKGTLHTLEMADFGTTPVYFDSHGIANVLSLYRLRKKYCMTYDSIDRGGVFLVHMEGGVVKFSPTPKGLHALDIHNNPDAAYLLVNNHNHHVNTVRDNYEGFSKKQIEQATTA